jgi:hypothetical protein
MTAWGGAPPASGPLNQPSATLRKSQLVILVGVILNQAKFVPLTVVGSGGADAVPTSSRDLPPLSCDDE